MGMGLPVDRQRGGPISRQHPLASNDRLEITKAVETVNQLHLS